MFETVAEVVRSHGARACRERVFVPQGRLRTFHKARRGVYPQGEVPASDWLMAGHCGAVGGVQVHAIRGAHDWRPLRGYEGGVQGWTFATGLHRWAVTSGLCVPAIKQAPDQAKVAFEAAEALLKQVGMDLTCVARTWLFLDDILSWYGDLNRVRNNLFISRGMLKRNRPNVATGTGGGGGGDSSRVPASTGMGVTPVLPARLSLECFAVAGDDDCVKRLSAAGKQRSAYEYGSAFARASVATTPAGRTIFVSGTAAIDEFGDTCFVGDSDGQIRMTLENVLAVLKDAHFSATSVVQAIAYCKTPAVAAAFEHKWMKELDWPWVTVIGDVCRDDLLFEVEATACEAADVN
jgi:enamine deaminase RidA (YjgF/YER057c/UK114 family)